MRTVSFSDAKVIELLDRHFVSSWKEISPLKRYHPGLYEKNSFRWTSQMLQPGAGETNICALLATADGKILHAVQGLATPEALLKELEFAVAVAKAVEAGKTSKELADLYTNRKSKTEGKDRFVRLLRRNLDTLAMSPLPPLDSVSDAKSAGLTPRR